MFSPSKPPIDIDFEKEMDLSSDEIRQLIINSRGTSPFYPDSYFSYTYNKSRYTLVRHSLTQYPPLQMPHFNQTGVVTLASFREFEVRKHDPSFPPIYAMDEFPEDTLIGNGIIGQVHRVSLGTTPLVLKIERTLHPNVKEGRRLTLNPSQALANHTIVVSPLSSETMPESFLKSLTYWESSKDIPHSDFIAEIKGLGFIKELNQWGVLYDYVDGYHFEDFRDGLKKHPDSIHYSTIIDISIQLTEALKILDDAGQPHTDLLQPNILIRKLNHAPVLIDYGGNRKKEHKCVESRQQFGKRLAELAFTLDDRVHDLKQLASDCQSSQSFDQLSWDIILMRLQQIKAMSISSVTKIGLLDLKNQSGDSTPSRPSNATTVKK